MNQGFLEWIDCQQGRQYELHERHLNPAFVKMIRTIGFDKNYVRGEGAWLFDAEGRRYLDLLTGWGVFALGRNHPKVRSRMRQDNLLCLRRKAFVVTTDSRHNLPVYPNVARDLTPDGVNQLWRADITYIRLRNEFVYLAVVLDPYSRRVIGWALGRTLEAELAVSALTMALRQRRPEPGLVHHSDRGVQYASYEYTDLLKRSGAQISMSRKGNPYDNAACESFMKTLKYEEVYRSEYRDLADAYAQIGEFLERVYNQHRLHSALGYVPPAEFEQNGGSIQ